MLHRNINCPTYKCPVLFYAGCSAKQFREHLLLHYDIEYVHDLNSDDGLVCTVCKGGVDTYIMWVRKMKSIPTLAHECLHLAYIIFADRGIPINKSNEEAIAYYLENWIDIFLKEIKNRNKKQSRRRN